MRTDFDGTKFHRYPFHFHIDDYQGLRKISTLPCYPIDYHDKPDVLRQRLIKRGEKFRKYYTAEGEQMYDYDGELLMKRNFLKEMEDEAAVQAAKTLSVFGEMARLERGRKEYPKSVCQPPEEILEFG